MLVGPLAIRRSRRKEKASKTEKVDLATGFAFNLNQSLQSLTRFQISKKTYKAYDFRIMIKNTDHY